MTGTQLLLARRGIEGAKQIAMMRPGLEVHPDLAHRGAQPYRAAMALQPVHGRIDEEGSKILSGQHEIAGGGGLAETVAQHAQEHGAEAAPVGCSSH